MNEKIIENTRWGQIKVRMAKDGKCEVFHGKNFEKFLSFYDGTPDDHEDRIIAYIEQKMF